MDRMRESAYQVKNLIMVYMMVQLKDLYIDEMVGA